MTGCSACAVGLQTLTPDPKCFLGAETSHASHPKLHNVLHRTCRGICNAPPTSILGRFCFRRESRPQKHCGRQTVATLALDREHVTLTSQDEANSKRAERRVAEKPRGTKRAVVQNKPQRNRTGRLVGEKTSPSDDLPNVVASDPSLGPDALGFDVPSAQSESSGLASTSGSYGLPSSRQRGSSDERGMREGDRRNGKVDVVVLAGSGNVVDKLGPTGGGVSGVKGGGENGARKSAPRRRAFSKVEPLQVSGVETVGSE